MKISPAERLGEPKLRNGFSDSSAFEPPVNSADSQPAVSIIISNYNYDDYVGKAIESALAQTYPNIEVIVVDDGSTDESKRVIEAFSGDSRLRCIFQENAGQAAAMNRGFEISTGEIVFFLDSDDMLDPLAAATIASKWNSGISHIQFPLELIDGDGVRRGLHPFSNHLEDGDIHWQLVVSGQYRFSPTSGNAFSRQALKSIMPIPEDEWRICADVYLTAIGPKFGPVVNLHEVLGCYRVHGLNNWYTEALGAARRIDIWQNHVKAWRALINHITVRPFRKDEDPRAIRNAAELYILKRVVIAEHRYPHSFSRLWRLTTIWNAILRLLTARLPLRHKFIYLSFFAAMAMGAYGNERTRPWINHRSGRPRPLFCILEKLKGNDFYSWMRGRDRLTNSLPEIEFGKIFQFGRLGSAKIYQWYGWTSLGFYADWCAGAEAALVAAAPKTTETLVFEAEVQPTIIGTVKNQRLEILANDLLVFQQTISSKTSLRVEIPTDAWRGRSELVLRFLTPDFCVPRFIQENSEGMRSVSFGFSWMRWSILTRPDQQVVAFPYLPLWRWVDLSADGTPYLAEGWHPSEDGLMRMNRRSARLHASVLEPSAGDFLLSLEFDPETALESCPLTVRTGALLAAHADLVRQSRIDLVLRRGSIPRSGALAVLFHAGAITGSDERMFKADGPAGPGLRRVRLQRVQQVAKRAVLQPGVLLDFRAGGNGAPYLDAGWYRPDEMGTKSSDVVAGLQGLWVDRESEIFVTAVLQPASSYGPLATPIIRILAGDDLVARYVIDGLTEVTAILPAGVVDTDRLLNLRIETDALLRPSDVGDDSETRPVGIILRSLMLT